MRKQQEYRKLVKTDAPVVFYEDYQVAKKVRVNI